MIMKEVKAKPKKAPKVVKKQVITPRPKSILSSAKDALKKLLLGRKAKGKSKVAPISE